EKAFLLCLNELEKNLTEDYNEALNNLGLRITGEALINKAFSVYLSVLQDKNYLSGWNGVDSLLIKLISRATAAQIEQVFVVCFTILKDKEDARPRQIDSAVAIVEQMVNRLEKEQIIEVFVACLDLIKNNKGVTTNLNVLGSYLL